MAFYYSEGHEPAPLEQSVLGVQHVIWMHLKLPEILCYFLPLWDTTWMSIAQIIDRLHIRNHNNTSCHEKYNPSSLKEEIPEGDTMAAEQMFVWLSRFEKTLCTMPKVHHLFYLHCMGKCQNKRFIFFNIMV